MTTAIDSNVLIALWGPDSGLGLAAQSALDDALGRGSLVVSAPVFAELMAGPARSENFLNSFFADTGVTVDWALPEKVWRAAGHAFQQYSARRRQQRGPGPRRILADFLIGGHASELGYRLLTLDVRLYRAAFPGLALLKL
jgi:predicted nucleic acid-binding protein